MALKRSNRYAVYTALVAAITLALAPSFVNAGGICGSHTTYRSFTYYPAYSYSYAPAYYAPAKVVQKVEYFEQPVKVVQVAYSPDYYSSVADYYREKLISDAAAGRAVEISNLKQEIALLRQQLQQGNGYQPQQQPQQPPQQTPQQPPQGQQEPYPRQGQQQPPPRQQDPSGGAARGRGYGAVPAALPAIVNRHCLRCHGNNNLEEGGGLDLRNLEAIDEYTRLLCVAAVCRGEMPKKADRLPEEEQRPFSEWYAAARKERVQNSRGQSPQPGGR